MATRKQVVVIMVVALLLLSGASMWGIFGSAGQSTRRPGSTTMPPRFAA